MSEDKRRRYDAEFKGYSTKRQWNKVNCVGNLPDSEIGKMIDVFYELVVKSLPKG